MRNCTANETQLYIVNKYGDVCQAGGFCRFYEPDFYQCQCLGNWTGVLCTEWDFALGRISIYVPLLSILMLLVIVSVILGAYCIQRRRRRQQRDSRRGAGP